MRPVLEQRPDLWPPASCGYDAFVHAAGMVQSRAFHMKKENWITGEDEDGKAQLAFRHRVLISV